MGIIMSMDGLAKAAIVGFGGFIGSVLRYSLGGLIQHRLGPTFPWQTLVINVSGSFLIGLFLGVALSQNWGEGWRLFIAVGILGGYTTYSTFAYETLRLLEDRSYMQAVGYFFGTSVLTVAAAFVGIVVARLLTRGAA